jgi:hypothetical protein
VSRRVFGVALLQHHRFVACPRAVRHQPPAVIVDERHADAVAHENRLDRLEQEVDHRFERVRRRDPAVDRVEDPRFLFRDRQVRAGRTGNVECTSAGTAAGSMPTSITRDRRHGQESRL